MADKRKKVLITDQISEEGIALLRQEADVDNRPGLKPEEIISIIGDYEALMVRSQTKVTADIIEAGKKLQVIARAGVGIDNVDVEAATRFGVVVVNAPTGNTVSAAEHAIALMLASARNIPQANYSLRGGAWKRNDFMGTELRGKTLGIIGLGNVGSEVAKRAQSFEMKLLGIDPLVSIEYAQKLQVELVELKRLLKESDFITLHLPLTPQTRKMLGAKELALCKPTARIINCARGGLIDEEALVSAIRKKKLAGAAIDVFEKEPLTESILFGEDNIIVTPHLGASTTEAQVLAARDVAEQIVDVFRGLPARAAVNVPYIPSETMAALAPYIKLAKTLCKLVYRLAEGQTKNIRIKYEGDIATFDTNALKATVVGGLLEGVSEERVNIVNVQRHRRQARPDRRRGERGELRQLRQPAHPGDFHHRRRLHGGRHRAPGRAPHRPHRRVLAGHRPQSRRLVPLRRPPRPARAHRGGGQDHRGRRYQHQLDAPGATRQAWACPAGADTGRAAAGGPAAGDNGPAGRLLREAGGALIVILKATEEY